MIRGQQYKPNRQLAAFRMSKKRSALLAALTGIVFIWPGTAATIPTGWERDTRFDGLCVLGADASGDGGGTGGSATHTHPNASNHLHAITFSTTAYNLTVPSGTLKIASALHTHASFNSANTSVVFGAASNLPPYNEVIFIKPTTATLISSGMITLWDGGVLPADYNEADGNGGRRDLRGKFLKGAASGADPGASGGTSNAHSHSSDHAHGDVSSSNSVGTVNAGGASDSFCTAHNHQTSIQSTSANVQNADGEPPAKKLMAIQYSGTGAQDSGIIGLWPDTLSSKPFGWTRVATQDTYFLKIASGSGEIGSTSGADQHNHTCNAHSGTATVNGNNNGTNKDAPGTSSAARDGHNHVATVGDSTVTVANNTAKNNYPEYIKVIFIKRN